MAELTNDLGQEEELDDGWIAASSNHTGKGEEVKKDDEGAMDIDDIDKEEIKEAEMAEEAVDIDDGENIFAGG